MSMYIDENDLEKHIADNDIRCYIVAEKHDDGNLTMPMGRFKLDKNHMRRPLGNVELCDKFNRDANGELVSEQKPAIHKGMFSYKNKEDAIKIYMCLKRKFQEMSKHDVDFFRLIECFIPEGASYYNGYLQFPKYASDELIIGNYIFFNEKNYEQ